MIHQQYIQIRTVRCMCMYVYVICMCMYLYVLYVLYVIYVSACFWLYCMYCMYFTYCMYLYVLSVLSVLSVLYVFYVCDVLALAFIHIHPDTSNAYTYALMRFGVDISTVCVWICEPQIQTVSHVIFNLRTYAVKIIMHWQADRGSCIRDDQAPRDPCPARYRDPNDTTSYP